MSDFDGILIDNVVEELVQFGEPVTVYPPAAASRAVTGIVTRGQPKMTSSPRDQLTPITVQLPNSAVTGISGAEWNERFEIELPKVNGGAVVRMRTLRPAAQDAAMITWELG